MSLKSPFVCGSIVALAIVATGACGGQQAGGPSEGAPSAARAVTRVDPATSGRILGRVVFKGAAPRNALIDMKSDPACLAAAGANPAADEVFLIGQDGAIENVFVYVKEGVDALTFDVPATPVVLEQRGCRYRPRVLGLQVGQPLEILNSDETLHNARSTATLNQPFNVGQPSRGSKAVRRFTAREVMVSFKCDVHSWMKAYAGVLNHPYFAVSGADGQFELSNLPPGVYVVEAWHEGLGTRRADVRVEPMGSTEVSFTFEAIPPSSPTGPES